MFCDGTSTAGVRTWFKEIELAGAEAGTEHIIEIAARSAAGSLRGELERYIKKRLTAPTTLNSRFEVPWAEVKAHLRGAFLHVDEDSALRDEVEKTRQSAYEPEANKQVETMISMVKFEKKPVATWGCASKDFEEGEKKVTPLPRKPWTPTSDRQKQHVLRICEELTKFEELTEEEEEMEGEIEAAMREWC